MNCRKVSHLISAYVDGELPGVEQLAIREHLSRCEECSQEHSETLQTKRMLAQLQVVAPREQMAAEIIAHLSRCDASGRPFGATSLPLMATRAIRYLSGSRSAGLAAALAVAGVFLAVDANRTPQIDWTRVDKPIGEMLAQQSAPAFLTPAVRPAYVSNRGLSAPVLPTMPPSWLAPHPGVSWPAQAPSSFARPFDPLLPILVGMHDGAH
ncbi:MAG TPA: zf-HC2 domain-containing protein [Chthonomonadales bacterium]|nr:zf-HC2 domain-containing protein [Chthonomonadales bacterium]